MEEDLPFLGTLADDVLQLLVVGDLNEVTLVIDGGVAGFFLAGLDLSDKVVYFGTVKQIEEGLEDIPGKGSFDFKALFDIVNTDSAVIELYSLGLDIEKELAQSKLFFDNLNG